MRILLISGGHPSNAPYIQYYTYALEKLDCQYDVVYWNRGNISRIESKNYYEFKSECNHNCSLIKKIWQHYEFHRFVRKHINKRNYNGIILFTLQAIPFYYDLLLGKFRDKFILDIRDYSKSYGNTIIKRIVNRCLNLSFANCISSPGFKHWLPQNLEYIISHNIHQKQVLDGTLTPFKNRENNIVKVLTIGQIRDVCENYQIIKSLSNSSQISLTFIGFGKGIEELKQHCLADGVKNTFFKGRYEKKDENAIVDQYDMINAYMPDNVLSRYLMSNRIYLSLLLAKPIIVSANSTQADYVSMYNLGIVINDSNNLEDAINLYWDNFDKDIYNEGRLEFLKEIIADMEKFDNTIKSFTSKVK